MKKFISYASVLLFFILAFGLAACKNNNDKSQTAAKTQSENETIEKTGLWENAIYLTDTEFGEGLNTVVVEITADDNTVTFTIHTDKETVGDALIENNLIAGDEGEFGLYVKAVNGMTADYDVDQSYWAFYINGEYAMSAVDRTDITDNTLYSLVCTK